MIVRVPLTMRRQMVTRAPADLDGTESEEDAEWLRGCRMTRKALMMRRTQSSGEGTRWPGER